MYRNVLTKDSVCKFVHRVQRPLGTAHQEQQVPSVVEVLSAAIVSLHRSPPLRFGGAVGGFRGEMDQHIIAT